MLEFLKGEKFSVINSTYAVNKIGLHFFETDPS
jgi:hypothetical protein